MQQKRKEHLFVVRLWRETDGQPRTWRGSIDHVATRQRHYFSDIEALTSHINDHIEMPQTRDSPEEPSEVHDGQEPL
jgi:hypothetical protein